MRLGAFIVALLLLAGAIAPTRGHLVLLVVFAGLAWVRLRPWRLLRLRPAADLRLASFVIALLLLAGTVDPTPGWLVALSVVSGLALVTPGWCAVDLGGPDGRRRRGAWRWMDLDWDWDCARPSDDDAWDERAGRRARRRERRWRRQADRFGDGWS